MNKYGNKKVEADGLKFDSKAEYEYYCQLKLLLAGKVIKDFVCQKEIQLLKGFRRDGKAVRGITYKADFVVEYKDGTLEIVDVKGVATEAYKIKRKLLLYLLSTTGSRARFVEIIKGERHEY